MIKTGTKESKIPATELLTFCCAKGNKNMGIKFPIAPARNTHGYFFLGTYFMFLSPKKRRAPAAIVILREPTWYGVNAAILCLIKIKELPQVSDSAINIIQF